MGRLEDITGEKFGRLLVLQQYIVDYQKFIVCKCDCGTIKTVRAIDVKNGKTTSCGCFLKSVAGNQARTHGDSRSTEYLCWMLIKNRCYNRKNKFYHRYGGRGIGVCDRWKNSFENFLKDMGRRPSKDHSIDRINNDGNYEPSNCRWATRREQSRNKSINVWYEKDGKRMIASDWAAFLGITQNRFWSAVDRFGFDEVYNKYTIPNYSFNYKPKGHTHEQARNKRNNVWIEYNGIKMIQVDWANYFGVTKSMLCAMIKRRGPKGAIEQYYKKRNSLLAELKDKIQ